MTFMTYRHISNYTWYEEHKIPTNAELFGASEMRWASSLFSQLNYTTGQVFDLYAPSRKRWHKDLTSTAFLLA
jgi:hypothetical protein